MIRTKRFEGFENLYLEPINGTQDWYCSKECKDNFCDLYEAEEIVKNTGTFAGATCYLIHYPDGKVYRPFEMKENRYIEKPVYDDGKLAFLVVDFASSVIQICHFQPEKEKLTLLAEMPLNMVKDCYNLSLTTMPLMLGRDGNDGRYEIVWPEKREIVIGETEVLFYRDHDKLYFSEWYEDPAYHENVVIRSIHTGEVLERFPGSMYHMPDGRFWVFS